MYFLISFNHFQFQSAAAGRNFAYFSRFYVILNYFCMFEKASVAHTFKSIRTKYKTPTMRWFGSSGILVFCAILTRICGPFSTETDEQQATLLLNQRAFQSWHFFNCSNNSNEFKELSLKWDDYYNNLGSTFYLHPVHCLFLNSIIST